MKAASLCLFPSHFPFLAILLRIATGPSLTRHLPREIARNCILQKLAISGFRKPGFRRQFHAIFCTDGRRFRLSAMPREVCRETNRTWFLALCRPPPQFHPGP